MTTFPKRMGAVRLHVFSSEADFDLRLLPLSFVAAGRSAAKLRRLYGFARV